MIRPGRMGAGITALALLSACGGSGTEVLDPWPFNIPQVELSCEAGRVFVTTPEGTRYAANGSARAVSPYLQPLLAHYDASAVIRRGLRLCEQGQSRVTLQSPAPAQSSPPPDAPAVTVEQQELGRGVFVTVEAETVVGGRRPRLVLVCDTVSPPSFQLYLVQAPSSPPPVRGVYGTFTVAGAQPQRIELAWGTEDSWSPRDNNAPAVRRVVQALTSGKNLSLEPPPGYSAPTTMRWRAATLSSNAQNIQRQCG